ncbi:hypothetical protein SRU_0649 [Salinibacter ruber DSM 13855]|uniref:Uncharacterized protein n=1 Tax=Salinibacter ruber (strain DSM 13855 / M31) TaxID=309807 RepID=Q2S4U4_SALRD|nr:hypothetical protein SRU_0649 [Salinibacter ruber DSM 13855]
MRPRTGSPVGQSGGPRRRRPRRSFFPAKRTVAPMMLPIALLQRAASFQADAPVGTGIEWLTLAAIFVPAVLLVVLVYWGAQETV